MVQRHEDEGDVKAVTVLIMHNGQITDCVSTAF